MSWWVARGSNPRPSVCKTDALPAELSDYITICSSVIISTMSPVSPCGIQLFQVGEGFEPPRSLRLTVQSVDLFTLKSTKRVDGVPERIRTSDPLIKSQMLYQLSYWHIYREDFFNALFQLLKAHADFFYPNQFGL